jgi:hypothetical protein
MAALYADENFPLPVVQELRRLGYDVLTVFEDGLANRRVADDAILQRATQLGRAVLTTNRRHFVKLHLESSTHQGVIACTFDPDFAGQAQRIRDAVQAFSSLDGQLVRVNCPGASG